MKGMRDVFQTICNSEMYSKPVVFICANILAGNIHV